jgi:hypothetical protein
MRHHRRGYHRGAFIGIVAALVLLAGCAGRRISDADSPSALPQTPDLAGTWHGDYWNLPIGNSYGDAADCTLQINDDSTFTATCMKSKAGANDIGRSSKWSGHVVTKGKRVVLEDDGGSWPSIVLTRSGNGTLYGVTLDPLVGATVEMKFARESGATSDAAGD